MSVTAASVTGSKTGTGHSYNLQLTVRETAGVAATVTGVTFAFFNGANQFATVTRTTNLPFTAVAAGTSASANWTIADDNGGNPYATRLQATVTFSDSTGSQTASTSADVPPLPQGPSTFTACGTIKEGSLGVADAQVQIIGSGRSTSTDGQGRYCFNDMAAGSLTLRVSKSGFNTLEQTITVTGQNLPDLELTRANTPAPSPTITSFTADSTSLTAGQSTTLRWSTSNATAASIDNGIGTVVTSGSRSISPSQTTTYRLTATNSSGSTDRTVTVTVGTSNPGGIPICSFSTPTGVTAVCNNGNFSMSQNRSGTCSSNQGVRCWVCPGPLCNP